MTARQFTCRSVLLVFVSSLLCCPVGTALSQEPAAERPLKPVTASELRTGLSKSSYQLLGTITPNRRSTLGYAVAGRMKSLNARRGDRVQSGEAISQLQTDVIKLEIAAAEAELQLARQQLAELESGSRKEDIAEGKARMDAARAVARKSAGQLVRMQRLVQSQAASADELDVAIAEADSSKELLAAASIAYDRLVAGPRKEQIAQAKARVDLQTKQVELLQDRLTKHTLKAPFDGYVINEFTDAGAWVSSGDPVLEMIELDTVKIEVAVPASQIVNVQTGQSIRVQSDDRKDALIVGKVERIVPAADSRARTFPMLVKVNNQLVGDTPMLLSGMVIRVFLPAGTASESMFVPTDSIVLESGGQSVFVIDVEGDADADRAAGAGRDGVSEDGTVVGTVRKVPVELGVADGEWIAVRGRLQNVRWVVTRGNEGLIEGDKVEAAASRG
ncbi:efflux RND transporter periplasmic adaptor subunit [Rhodopirellula sp. MGV]|uniref:efflux RND transporter periplasmic adaptor subunit n=1 Tax=Rhodopirellula sp. MGV TaxID=2023130 RepID=UPI000B974DD5|nr:efflux RND transporter periplasmic adaptor subunit [Rhodopirellula sp. MGV]OYP37066.1 hypothetical protein CGZ80_06875 [Rhodopirellula sp. MGV]PNY36171.1 efflux RND transporter periplasmic adaptor subunit [Rhodopirellula baltica]